MLTEHKNCCFLFKMISKKRKTNFNISIAVKRRIDNIVEKFHKNLFYSIIQSNHLHNSQINVYKFLKHNGHKTSILNFYLFLYLGLLKRFNTPVGSCEVSNCRSYKNG